MERFQHIAFLAHEEAPSPRMLDEVFDLAIANQARVTLFDVVRPVANAFPFLRRSVTPAQIQATVVEQRQKRLQELANCHKDANIQIDLQVLVGKPLVEIVGLIDRYRVDLLMQSSAPDDGAGRFLGSLAKSCIRHVPCPVWTLQHESYSGYSQVLAAIDLEDVDEVHAALNRDVLRFAVSLAARRNVPLHVVTIWDFWLESAVRYHEGSESIDSLLAARQSDMEEQLAQVVEDQNIYQAIDRQQVRLHAIRGVPAMSIHQMAESHQMDLLVMGTVCRTGISGFLVGNTAERLIDRAHYSVLALKPDGFVCPIRPVEPSPPLSDDRNPLPIV